MHQPERWALLAVYSAVYEAEIAAGRLRDSGLLARVDAGEAVGLFGASFQGHPTRGVRLLVPSNALEAARALLEDDPDEA